MKSTKVSIGLINPKSPSNVGSVMRAAGNYRVDSVFYTGKRYARALELKTDTANLSRKIGENIPLSATNCLIENATGNTKIICVEFAENAIPLPEYLHPDNALYIFGPEDGTITQDIINKADDVVYIPTIGCMNLAATVNVLLYDRLSKSSRAYDNNDLIRQSRDRNNNRKVKLAKTKGL
jgi:tRNA(Leu) C34 or U34 (ribose-2'-O)-methylase TrmL